MNRRFINYLAGMVLAVLCVPLVSSAQQNTLHDCGVSAAESALIKNKLFDNRRNKAELLKRLEQFNQSRNNDSTFHIPIQWHVIGTSAPNSDGEYGYLNGESLLRSLCQTNDDYHKFGVDFYLNNSPSYWNQSLLYTSQGVGDAMLSYWMGIYKDTVGDPLNLFVAGTGRPYYTSALDVIFLEKGRFYPGNSTLTHEIGHLFSLNHTFYGFGDDNYVTDIMTSSSNTKQATPSIISTLGLPVQVENLHRPNDGSGDENCQYAADGFCDTWPDYAFGPAMSGCGDYGGTAIDPLGKMMVPELLEKEVGAAIPLKSTIPHKIYLTNKSPNRRIYNSTVIYLKKMFVRGTDTIMLGGIDTLGLTDTTRAGIPANNKANVVYPQPAQGRVMEGYINLGGAYVDIEPSVAGSPAAYFPKIRIFKNNTVDGIRLDSVNPAIPSGMVPLDSIMVVNGSLTDTIHGGAAIVINKKFIAPDGTVYNSSTANLDTLPNLITTDILPGDTMLYKISFANTTIRNSVFGDGRLHIEATNSATERSYPNKRNIMSYFPCRDSFTQEQREAIRLDIVARGYDKKFNVPAENPITDKPTLVHPTSSGTVNNTVTKFQWDPTPKATMYLVNVYQGSKTANITSPLIRSEITSDLEMWYTLPDTGLYSWTVVPINARDFCIDDSSHVKSDTLDFTVLESWAVGIDQHNSEIVGSKVYPNPSNSNAILEIETKTLGQAHVSMTNALGQRVLSRQAIPLHPGFNTEIIDVSNMPSGLYFIDIETNEKRITHKLMVQHHR
ncbi:MAG: T9SS type A sorting domain-containing protein [Aureispira sp.]|nr:T9SS type A sorting domain-containing protein [Aureispira sp.]